MYTFAPWVAQDTQDTTPSSWWWGPRMFTYFELFTSRIFRVFRTAVVVNKERANTQTIRQRIFEMFWTTSIDSFPTPPTFVGFDLTLTRHHSFFLGVWRNQAFNTSPGSLVSYFTYLTYGGNRNIMWWSVLTSLSPSSPLTSRVTQDIYIYVCLSIYSLSFSLSAVLALFFLLQQYSYEYYTSYQVFFILVYRWGE